MNPLSCTVRGCGEPLHREGRALKCSRGHAFDVAREGYVNLLQPQDRRSREPGDARAAVEARAALLAAGFGLPLIESVVARLVQLPVPAPAVIVELGSGSGEMLAAIAAARPTCGIGIDLSTAAAIHAARRFGSIFSPDNAGTSSPQSSSIAASPLCPPTSALQRPSSGLRRPPSDLHSRPSALQPPTSTLAWLVANADRRLPVLDAAADVVISIHARRNPKEAGRILKSTGFLLVAVPAADDLLELRAAVQGDGTEQDRSAMLIAEHADGFDVVDRWTLRQQEELDRDALIALLRGTYRGERFSESERVQELATMHVTLASDVVVFAPRR